MTPFNLYLMRHGEPEQTGLMLGRTDCPSTIAGIVTCQEQVQDIDVATLISSGLLRTDAAANAIGSSLSLPISVDRRWREMDFGEWDGVRRERIDPGALARFMDAPDQHAPPGGETWSDLVGRVGSAISELEPRDTLVVTHAGTMRAALSYLCGFSYQQGWSVELLYASLLCLRVWPGERPMGQIFGLWP